MGRGSFELLFQAVPQYQDFACALSSAKVGIRFAIPWGVVVAAKVLAIIVTMAAIRAATCVECFVLVMLAIADSY